MQSRYKFTVVVNGRFHAFDYARELYKMGLLDKLISTMPYGKAKAFGIPKTHYVGFPAFEIIKVVCRKVFKKELPVIKYSKLFNRLVGSHIPDSSNVIISFAGYSKEIFASEKNINKIKILDRGSTHTLENIKLKKQAAKYHNTFYKPHPGGFVDREIKEYELANFILVPSTFVKNTFVKNGIPESKIIVNSYAVSEQKFSRSDKNIQREAYTILFVGQLSPRKGIKVLIDAYKIVKKSQPKAKLWLVGALNGVNEDMLKIEGITYFGVLKGKDLQNKFQSATLFCLPSFEEGLALVLTEAKHFDLPIIATPNSGVEELFRKSSNDFKLFEAGNPKDLSNKIIKCLDNKTEKHLGSELKTKTWQDFTNQLINMLDNVKT